MAKAMTPEPFSTSKTSNWVARVGGLPPYIQHVAHDLVEKGHSESHAIEMAVGIIKNWAHGHNGKGGKVHGDTQAAAQLALKQWEEKKARAHMKEGLGIKATDEECEAMGASFAARLTLVEGVYETLKKPTQLALANAEQLFAGKSARLNLSEASQPADPERVQKMRTHLVSEMRELRILCGGFLSEARMDPIRTAQLQRRLSSVGFELSDDGNHGPKTKEAVRRFQHHAGLAEDGEVGPKTTAALQQAPTPEEMEGADAETPDEEATDETPDLSGDADAGEESGGEDAAEGGEKTEAKKKSYADKTLHKGMGVDSGPDGSVRDLQAHLEELGSPNIELDGRFGPQTHSAVKRFQTKMGMKSDGIVGPKTAAVMRRTHKRMADAHKAMSEAKTSTEVVRAQARVREITELIEAGCKMPHGAMAGRGKRKCPNCGADLTNHEKYKVQEAALSARGRKRVDDDNFALPGRRYPIHDISHARNALSRVAQHGTEDEKKKVRAAVHRKYPSLKGGE